ncbi:ATP-grasp domain-containing protein [Polaribacter sp. IC073]|uniref:ATP-grasp domain-containing protein n=1 Tax=Polaribacter sp. IC073 TaxID=2508540 RepID=UPI0011BD7984|nr:ATP-grasp domain-containing protein [Polaribacter sp. IC073]TXD47754.1 ATP-grasp domain-containing protein [Polaribacter sp. IC073]
MNLLITSTGRRGYMVDYFKSAIGNKGKVFAANSEYTLALNKADEFIITPNIFNASYIDFLLDYCREKKINAIISLFDIDLPVLSKNKKIFKDNGIVLLISDVEFTTLCNDKWLTYNFLLNNNFKTAKSYISLEDFHNDFKCNKIEFPVFLKPRWGMGSIGVFEAQNEEELNVFYKKVKKEILNSYLKYESNYDIEHAIIIQEKIKGQEHGLDILNDLNGNYICSVPKIKIAMRAGETDIAETIINDKLEKLAKMLADKTKHLLNLDVDCFIEGNTISILEMNARFGGQYPFSHISGVNFPKVIINLLEGKSINKEDITFQPTVAFKELYIRKKK